MIDPYLAVGLQTKVKHVSTRDEVNVNLKHIGNMIDMVTHMCSLELPVRLIALGEGAIQGFVDEIMDIKGSVEIGNGFSIIGRYARETGDWYDPGEYETSTYTGIKVGIGKAFDLKDNTDITTSIFELTCFLIST